MIFSIMLKVLKICIEALFLATGVAFVIKVSKHIYKKLIKEIKA